MSFQSFSLCLPRIFSKEETFMTKKLFQWAVAAAIAVALPMCVTSCVREDLDDPTTPTEQPTEQPTEDAMKVTIDKSFVLYGVPSEGIGEAVCRRLKGSGAAPSMAEVYILDPSKTDNLGIGVENWKEMVRRTWYGDAAVVLTQCSYRNFYRFTVNYILGALALKAEMNGEELDLSDYDSDHVSTEREMLANAVRSAYQMYRANHSAPGEVEEKDWAHIDQWPIEEQNAIMLDAYGFCQGNELYVMNASVNWSDTIDGENIPAAQPETAYQWGQKADAVADWVNRQGMEDAETRAGLASFRRAITRANDATSIESLMSAQTKEFCFDYEYPSITDPTNSSSWAYSAINVQFRAYSAYDFNKDDEYYNVRQTITVMNDRINNNDNGGWFSCYYDNLNHVYFSQSRGSWMDYTYTKLKLEGDGQKHLEFYNPGNKEGSTSYTTTQGGSSGNTFGFSLGGNYGMNGLSLAGNFNFSHTSTVTWSTSENLSVDNIGTEYSQDTDGAPQWVFRSRELNFDETSSAKAPYQMKRTFATDETAIWRVEHPKGSYQLSAWSDVVSEMVELWTGGIPNIEFKRFWNDSSNRRYYSKHTSHYVNFTLISPLRFKADWNNYVINYGNKQGNTSESANFDEYLENTYGVSSKAEVKCWAGAFTTSEATADGSDNARAIFQSFRSSISGQKEVLKSKGYAGRMVFALKRDGEKEPLDSIVLNLDNDFSKGSMVTEKINGYDVTFKVTKADDEVELSSVPENFQGHLLIPKSVLGGQLMVTSLGKRCASSSKGITRITIPESVTYINDYAFYLLPSLAEVHVLANTPPALGDNVFTGSCNDAVLYVPAGCEDTYVKTDGWSSFKYFLTDGTRVVKLNGYDLTFQVTKENEEVKLIKVPEDYQGALDIPQEIAFDGKQMKVTALGVNCAAGRGGITSVSLPSTLREIEEGALSRLNIKHVTVPEGVQTIGIWAFHKTKCEDVHLPSTLQSIGNNAFRDMDNLYNIYCKATQAPSMGTDVFTPRYADAILCVAQGSKDEYTYAKEWENFKTITDSPHFVNQRIYVDTNGYELTYLMTKESEEVKLINVPEDYKGALDIPQEIAFGGKQMKVTALGVNCAAGRGGITSVSLPGALREIEEGALSRLNISHVTVPEGVQTIGIWAFHKTKCEDVHLPSTLQSIGYNAFRDMDNLNNVYCKATQPPVLGSDVFTPRYADVVLTVPKGCLDVYANAEEWKNFQKIYNGKHYLDERFNYMVNGYNLTFRMTVEDEEVELESVPDDFKGVLDIPAEITDGLKVTALGEWCCENRTGVTEVQVPEGVKVMKAGVFRLCQNINTIYLPSTLTEIGESCFYKTKASEVHIKATTPPSLGDETFTGLDLNVVLYVPTGCKEAYANADEWKVFKSIVEE